MNEITACAKLRRITSSSQSDTSATTCDWEELQGLGEKTGVLSCKG